MSVFYGERYGVCRVSTYRLQGENNQSLPYFGIAPYLTTKAHLNHALADRVE